MYNKFVFCRKSAFLRFYREELNVNDFENKNVENEDVNAPKDLNDTTPSSSDIPSDVSDTAEALKEEAVTELSEELKPAEEALSEVTAATELKDSVKEESVKTEDKSSDFFAGHNSFKFDREAEKRYEKSIGGLWKTIGIISLAVIMAFSGAFFGVVWVCQSALFGESEFLKAFIASSSGITVNRVEVDYISGQYQPTDSMTLAEKVLQYTVSIQARVYDAETGEYSDPSNGSGVVISYDKNTGYATIVTNHHVVYGSNYFRVIMSDSTVYEGKLLHLDEIGDLAILQIKTNKEVPHAVFSDSDNAVYGQQIVACGNPLGYNSSVSFGYISCPKRVIPAENAEFIQVDASVNPGNSGGGLYDAQGNLLGIIVSKASGTNVDGIGFAIPSNRVKQSVHELLTYGYVKGRPSLGVTVATVNASTWDYFNENELAGLIEKYKYGVYVIDTKDHLKGILKKGDRIVSIDGANLSEPLTLTSKEQVSQAIMKHKVGDKLVLKIERGTKGEDGTFTFDIMSFEITLGERDWVDENQVA